MRGDGFGSATRKNHSTLQNEIKAWSTWLERLMNTLEKPGFV